MHFFVWLLILLLIILIVTIIGGAVYLSGQSSSQALLKEVVFKTVQSEFTNGVAGDTVWPVTGETSGNSTLASVQDLRTFLPPADWLRTSPMNNTTLPMYFVLPEPATTLRTYLVSTLNIVFPSGYDNLIGTLLTPTTVGLLWANGEVASTMYFNGSDIAIGTPQDLGVVMLYTTD